MFQPQFPKQQRLKTIRQLRGQRGEDLAAAFLLSKGYKVIDRNAKKRYGEIDIVALDGDTLVFIEVKTRYSRKYGPPEEAITSWKLHALVRSAHYYKLTHPDLPNSMRIDLVAIEMEYGELKRIEVIKNIS